MMNVSIRFIGEKGGINKHDLITNSSNLVSVEFDVDGTLFRIKESRVNKGCIELWAVDGAVLIEPISSNAVKIREVE